MSNTTTSRAEAALIVRGLLRLAYKASHGDFTVARPAIAAAVHHIVDTLEETQHSDYGMLIGELQFHSVQWHWETGIGHAASQSDVLHWLSDLLDLLETRDEDDEVDHDAELRSEEMLLHGDSDH